MRKHYYGVGKQNEGSGITFIDALTLIFIVLKLTGVIDWSWLWVLSPIWVTIILIVVSVVALKFDR